MSAPLEYVKKVLTTVVVVVGGGSRRVTEEPAGCHHLPSPLKS
jgi:hypothetical protein